MVEYSDGTCVTVAETGTTATKITAIEIMKGRNMAKPPTNAG